MYIHTYVCICIKIAKLSVPNSNICYSSFVILVIPIGHQMSKKKQPLQIAPPICLASRFKSLKISALVPRRNSGPLRRIGAMTRRQVLRSSPSPPWGGEQIVVLFELSQQNWWLKTWQWKRPWRFYGFTCWNWGEGVGWWFWKVGFGNVEEGKQNRQEPLRWVVVGSWLRTCFGFFRHHLNFK